MYFRLSLLMLLQWAVPGSLVPLYSLRLSELGFTPLTIAVCCATQAVAVAVSSLLAGWAADRWVAAEKAMAVCSALASVALWLIAVSRDPVTVFLLTLFFWLVTGPMLLMGTTICFTHLPRPERQFGPVRMWGTVGWMLVVWLIAAWLSRPLVRLPNTTSLDDAPRIGAVIAFLLAGYTLTLPATPPRQGSQPGANWLAALGHLREPAFAAYLLCLLGVCITFPFSTQNLPLLLRELGIAEARIGMTLSLAQVTEVVLLGVLPVMLRVLGLRLTMGLGLASWLIAFVVLAQGGPTWLVIASLGLHGLFITGFMIAGQVYANSLTGGDLRASVQGLVGCVNALGGLMGNLLAGWLREATGELPRTFAVASCIVAGCLLLFVVGFRSPNTRPPEPR